MSLIFVPFMTFVTDELLYAFPATENDMPKSFCNDQQPCNLDYFSIKVQAGMLLLSWCSEMLNYLDLCEGGV